MMNFKDELNLSLAGLALGERLNDFNLEDENDNKIVAYAVYAYLQGINVDDRKRNILMKLSRPAYDSKELLKPLGVLTDSERAYVMGSKENQCIIEDNNCDAIAKTSKKMF